MQQSGFGPILLFHICSVDMVVDMVVDMEVCKVSNMVVDMMLIFVIVIEYIMLPLLVVAAMVIPSSSSSQWYRRVKPLTSTANLSRSERPHLRILPGDCTDTHHHGHHDHDRYHSHHHHHGHNHNFKIITDMPLICHYPSPLS